MSRAFILAQLGHSERALHGALRQSMTIPDLQTFLPDTPVRLYVDFNEFETLEEAAGPTGQCIFLYEIAKNVGHWCALFLRGSDGAEVFDPYGVIPDDMLLLLDAEDQRKLDQDHPVLTELLLRSGRSVQYNNHHLQSTDPAIATCGRHCIMRLLASHLNIDQYARMIQSSKVFTPDEIVTLALWPSRA